jgi:hypothetical protein
MKQGCDGGLSAAAAAIHGQKFEEPFFRDLTMDRCVIQDHASCLYCKIEIFAFAECNIPDTNRWIG